MFTGRCRNCGLKFKSAYDVCPRCGTPCSPHLDYSHEVRSTVSWRPLFFWIGVLLLCIAVGLLGTNEGAIHLPSTKDWLQALNTALLLWFGLVIYFFPTNIAVRHQHTDVKAIFALNLLLGWTFIGWVVAVVWAYKRP
jgi:uncharacterized membrane protein